MPNLSVRGSGMPESPIRKLVPFAEAAKKKGRIIYHLNIGQPDIETPESALAGVRNNDLKVIAYSHSAGIESYRRKLAGYYRSFDINVDFTDILITTGGSEAIVFAFLSCLDTGDEVIIPEPFYANYNGFAVTAGVTIRPITSRIEDGFALPPISDFEKLITPRTMAILINNPNNPTGYLYSLAELQALRDIVRKHDLYLFADEVYKEFCYEGNEFVSAMHLEGVENNVVVMDSISKRYSACGMRIGALVSKNKEVISTALKFAQARLSPPTYGQIAGEAAIDTPDSYFEDVRAEYVRRRDIVVQSLNNMAGVVCPRPQGAFYVATRLPIDDADRFCQWLLEDFEYNNETVMLAPMAGFYSTPGLGKNEVRIGYVLNVDALKKAMKCLAEALAIYPGRTN
ncbi:MAG: pyridoxal phosphate-dependent aminotransferase [candidate division Zixibacteria bacterium]|nr:pyridoxal phosphate-dependent aminotransferase [candidate division Zixibacteria bacterium]